MDKNRKIQLKAMNEALYKHAVTMAKEAGLTPPEINTVKQNVKYGAPYTSIETYKTNKL